MHNVHLLQIRVSEFAGLNFVIMPTLSYAKLMYETKIIRQEVLETSFL